MTALHVNHHFRIAISNTISAATPLTKINASNPSIIGGPSRRENAVLFSRRVRARDGASRTFSFVAFGEFVSCTAIYDPRIRAQSRSLSKRAAKSQIQNLLPIWAVKITDGSLSRRKSCLGAIPASHFQCSRAYRIDRATATQTASAASPATSSIDCFAARRAGNGSPRSWMDVTSHGGSSTRRMSDFQQRLAQRYEKRCASEAA